MLGSTTAPQHLDLGELEERGAHVVADPTDLVLKVLSFATAVLVKLLKVFDPLSRCLDTFFLPFLCLGWTKKAGASASSRSDRGNVDYVPPAGAAPR